MPVTKIRSKWVNGALCFYNATTGEIVLKIGPDGINAVFNPSTSPSVSPSVSPST